jgi:hypothetical protein
LTPTAIDVTENDRAVTDAAACRRVTYGFGRETRVTENAAHCWDQSILRAAKGAQKVLSEF